MAIDYERMKIEGPKLKAELTRASKKGYTAVLHACIHAVTSWNVIGAWPDNWSHWQRALDDAASKQNHTTRLSHVIAPRLETL